MASLSSSHGREQAAATNNKKPAKYNNSAMIVKFNVGGKMFYCSRETLESSDPNNTDQQPNFFSKMLEDDPATSMVLKDENNAFFVDRNPTFFSIILEYLQTGELHIPAKLIPQAQIPPTILSNSFLSSFSASSQSSSVSSTSASASLHPNLHSNQQPSESSPASILHEFNDLNSNLSNINLSSTTPSNILPIGNPSIASQPSSIQAPHDVHLDSMMNHNYNAFCIRLLKEADFYMVDISDKLYNIVSDCLYISDTKSRKCILFFDRDPSFKPGSLYMSGLFFDTYVIDKEVFVRNGCIEIYSNAVLQYILYPSTLSTTIASSSSSTPSVPTTTSSLTNAATSPAIYMSPKRRNSSLDNFKEFLPTSLLEEASSSKPPSPRESSSVQQGSSYATSSSPTVPSALAAMSSADEEAAHPVSLIQVKDVRTFCNLTYLLREALSPPTIQLRFDKEYFNLSSYNNSVIFTQLDAERVRVIEQRSFTLQRQRSFSSAPFASATVTSKEVVEEDIFRIIKPNFLAKNKKDFIYVESRNRIKWVTFPKSNVRVFELSNKKL